MFCKVSKTKELMLVIPIVLKEDLKNITPADHWQLRIADLLLFCLLKIFKIRMMQKKESCTGKIEAAEENLKNCF